MNHRAAEAIQFNMKVLRLAVFFSLFAWLPPSSAILVCYSPYGCFSDAEPYGKYLMVPRIPLAPSSVGTRFFLYTNESGPYELEPETEKANVPDEFNPALKTRIVIHGYRDKGIDDRFVIPLRQALQSHKEPMNIIIVDWRKGAGQKYYPVAVGNTRLVGVQVARLIDWLVKNTATQLQDFHLIGFSLGAHVCGYAGEWFKQRGRAISRITGLDPAGPGLGDEHPLVRLDPSDGTFIDVIHTNSRGFGTTSKLGHVDYWPNGGKHQPRCKNKDNVDGATDMVGCSHSSAWVYYTEAVNSQCPWRAFLCRDWSSFLGGECFDCQDGKCPYMGLNSTPVSNLGNAYLTTDTQSTYCVYHYQVSIITSVRRGAGTVLRSISVQLQDESGKKTTQYEHDDMKDIDRGDVTSFIVRSQAELSNLSTVVVEFKTLGWNKWHVKEIIIKPADSNTGFVATVDDWLKEGRHSFTLQFLKNPNKYISSANSASTQVHAKLVLPVITTLLVLWRTLWII